MLSSVVRMTPIIHIVTKENYNTKNQIMKAFDVLLALHRLDMRQGKDYLEAPKKNDLELNVLEGKLKRNHWYWCDFHKQPMLGEPAVILTLGGGDIQYLYEVEK